MHRATDIIHVNATPDQAWQVLSNLHRLPEWYVPAQHIKIITGGPIRENWQFVLAVRTLSGVELDALGTVKELEPDRRLISWSGQAFGIAGESRWQIIATEDGTARIVHTFQGTGWLLFLSQKLGRNKVTVRQRLTNLKALIEKETTAPVKG